MKDQTQKEAWVELEVVLDSCSQCVFSNSCKQTKAYIGHCFKAKYRFRCPVEVLDERTEE